MASQHQSQAAQPALGLPDVITRYLVAHRGHDTDGALSAFTDNATVIDDGKPYEGTEAIRAWLGRSSTEYMYTTELIGAQAIDATHYVATNHLAGNFPGGTVDFRYQFALREGLIERLVIEP